MLLLLIVTNVMEVIKQPNNIVIDMKNDEKRQQ
jgi:hypothetical protein